MLLTVFAACLQESLAFIFEMAHLHEDALREYDELELCYLETGTFLCLSWLISSSCKIHVMVSANIR